MKWDEEDFQAEKKHDQRWKVQIFQGPADGQVLLKVEYVFEITTWSQRPYQERL